VMGSTFREWQYNLNYAQTESDRAAV